MKYSQSFLTHKRYSVTSMFLSQPCSNYLLVHLAELSHHPRLVSLMSPWWKNYFQVSPRKIFENFTFSSVNQSVFTGVPRQGVLIST